MCPRAAYIYGLHDENGTLKSETNLVIRQPVSHTTALSKYESPTFMCAMDSKISGGIALICDLTVLGFFRIMLNRFVWPSFRFVCTTNTTSATDNFCAMTEI